MFLFKTVRKIPIEDKILMNVRELTKNIVREKAA